MKTETIKNKIGIEIQVINISIDEMKSEFVNKTNFHDCTVANWIESEVNFIADYKSGSGSEYMFTDKGVYRKSNHWLKTVNTCIWLLNGIESNNDTIAFCSFENFKKYSSKRNSKNQLSNDYKKYQDSIIEMINGEMINAILLGNLKYNLC